tara:strand:- start:482 stop:595 length:114 start_codon:yes stop_codon:yes gene_type:complete
MLDPFKPQEIEKSIMRKTSKISSGKHSRNTSFSLEKV